MATLGEKMCWVRLTDATSGQDVWVNFHFISLIETDRKGTHLRFNAGNPRWVQESPDQIIQRVWRGGTE